MFSRGKNLSTGPSSTPPVPSILKSLSSTVGPEPSPIETRPCSEEGGFPSGTKYNVYADAARDVRARAAVRNSENDEGAMSGRR